MDNLFGRAIRVLAACRSEWRRAHEAAAIAEMPRRGRDELQLLYLTALDDEESRPVTQKPKLNPLAKRRKLRRGGRLATSER